MKKVYTAAFKAQVALDLLKEEKTLVQISAEYGVHANVLRDWRTQALKGLPTIFDRRDDIAALKTTHTQPVDDLYAEIGRRTTQLNWLKKSCHPPVSDPTRADRGRGGHAAGADAGELARHQPDASLVPAGTAIGA